jgi:hypothetical protein
MVWLNQGQPRDGSLIPLEGAGAHAALNIHQIIDVLLDDAADFADGGPVFSPFQRN